MIDIHHHIIPQIDDGAQDDEMTLKMLKMAVEEGITKIIATPHYILGCNQYKEYEDIVNRVQYVNEIAKNNNLNIEIYPGNEVFIDSGIDEWVINKKVVTLNHSKYLLVESSLSGVPDFIDQVLYQLQLKGIIMILAHPERYKNIQKSPNKLIPHIEKGMLVQVNVGSILGIFGEEVQKTVENLIKHNMVHFVATDAHSDGRRSPKCKEAFTKVIEWVGEEKAAKLFIENPKAILENQFIAYEEPIRIERKEEKKKKGLLSFFRRS